MQSDDILVDSEEKIWAAVMRYADMHKDKRDEILQTVRSLFFILLIFFQVLPSIRFSFLSVDFLLEKVEGDPSIQHLPCVRKLLHEAYRVRVLPETAKKCSFSTKPR